MKIFVTGGAGFIGSNFVRYWNEKYPHDDVVVYDGLTYAGNLHNLQDLKCEFIHGNLLDKERLVKALDGVDVVVNFAAESHNDNAILNPYLFLESNVLGLQNLLNCCLELGNIRLHHISTCEVFGDMELDAKDSFKETDPFLPRTPYNASKAAGNHVVMSYFHTFESRVSISHCCNNYGPFQFPEKLIPLFVTNALAGRMLPLFKSSQNKREWIHVDDHNAAVDFILQNGEIGQSYNIGTGVEKSVEEITDIILDQLGFDDGLKEYVPDRKGHDKRYLLDCTKLKDLGWSAKIDFETGIASTIDWYVENKPWWESVLDGSYKAKIDL